MYAEYGRDAYEFQGPGIIKPSFITTVTIGYNFQWEMLLSY